MKILHASVFLAATTVLCTSAIPEREWLKARQVTSENTGTKPGSVSLDVNVDQIYGNAIPGYQDLGTSGSVHGSDTRPGPIAGGVAPIGAAPSLAAPRLNDALGPVNKASPVGDAHRPLSASLTSMTIVESIVTHIPTDLEDPNKDHNKKWKSKHGDKHHKHHKHDNKDEDCDDELDVEENMHDDDEKEKDRADCDCDTVGHKDHHDRKDHPEHNDHNVDKSPSEDMNYVDHQKHPGDKGLMNSNNSTSMNVTSSSTTGGEVSGLPNANATDGNSVRGTATSQTSSTLSSTHGHKSDTAGPTPIPTAKVSHSGVSGYPVPASPSSSLSSSFARTVLTTVTLSPSGKAIASSANASDATGEASTSSTPKLTSLVAAVVALVLFGQ